jgi:hypothetical protein
MGMTLWPAFHCRALDQHADAEHALSGKTNHRPQRIYVLAMALR